MSGLEAAKDAVAEALARAASSSGSSGSAALEVDEASPHYVNFQLVAPALAAVAKQLERLASSAPARSNPAAYAANQRALSDVCDAYAAQRVQLLAPVLAAAFEAASQSSDIVNLVRVAASVVVRRDRSAHCRALDGQLRVSCAYLVKVCDAEFRLFLKLFGREPRDALFVFRNEHSEADEGDNGTETPFEYVAVVCERGGGWRG